MFLFGSKSIVNGNAIQGMSFEQITTYYILVVSLNPIISWGINESIGNAIRDGEIMRELLNPISYFSYYFGLRIGELEEAVLVGFLTFITCSIIFKVLLPQSLLNLIFFLIVVCLAVIAVFLFEITLGMTAFYTNSIWGIEILKRAIIHIFAGMIAPIELFPEWLQKISNILPFKEFIYTPINIYFGNLNSIEILLVILKLCLWILIFYVLAKFVFNKAIKNVTINGG